MILLLFYLLLLLIGILLSFFIAMVYYYTGTFNLKKLPEIMDIYRRSSILKGV